MNENGLSKKKISKTFLSFERFIATTLFLFFHYNFIYCFVYRKSKNKAEKKICKCDQLNDMVESQQHY